MESDYPPLRRAFRTALFVSASLIAGLFLYAIVIEFVKSRFGPFSGFLAGPHPPALRYIFYGAAVGAVLLLRTVTKAMVRPDPGEDVIEYGQRLSRASAVTAALAEIPAVLGFVLFLLSGSARDFYPLLFVSLFLEFMYFPRFSVWLDLVKNAFPQQGN